MIGNIEDAEFVSEWDWSEIPDGWKFVGEGSQRLVVMGPENILYKKEKPGNHDCNTDEYCNLVYALKYPIAGWRVPKTSLYVAGYNPVIAMEYVSGSFDIECVRFGRGFNSECSCGLSPCSAWEWEKPQNIWNIIDLSETNVLIEPDGTRVLIDLVG